MYASTEHGGLLHPSEGFIMTCDLCHEIKSYIANSTFYTAKLYKHLDTLHGHSKMMSSILDGSMSRTNRDLEWWCSQDKEQYRGQMVAFLDKKVILAEPCSMYNMEAFFKKLDGILGKDSERRRAVSLWYVPEKDYVTV